MKKYLATNGVKLSYGLVRLDKDQARARADNVNPTDNRTLMLEKTDEDGVFAINGSIEFRAGEKFEWTGDASRMTDRIQCLDVEIEEAAEEVETETDAEVAEDELAEIIIATNGGAPTVVTETQETEIELEQETDGSEEPEKEQETKAPKPKQKKNKGKGKSKK